MTKVSAILKERGTKYGNYLEQCTISQKLKGVMVDSLKGKVLSPDQADALEMISVKIARIINGDPNYADNWHDIAGYATLVANRLDGQLD